MEDLSSLIDWSRAQFAMTAIYHWLFVPLTLGLAVIVGVMETIYYRTRSQRWLAITKFWMTLFGINFAMGVATGIILEFEFGTNWSNYSWFVGDIFGAPLAIEGILAFFLESTFVVVMFFGWDKVSRGFHLASTWITGIGATLSAAWILIANAWMQNPAGVAFDPAGMRNVMTDFWAVVFNPVAVHKFIHAVANGWVLGAVFVISVSCWMLMKRRNREFAVRSFRVAAWVGAVGMIVTLWSGDGSAVDVARFQPMKLAAMEGIYNGHNRQGFTVVGILDPEVRPGGSGETDPFSFRIEVPAVLSYLCSRDVDAFVPGINDLLSGHRKDKDGTVYQVPSVADRIVSGKIAHEALRDFDRAQASGDEKAMADAAEIINARYRDFGYGYLASPYEAVPPVALTFYSFHIMVIFGGYLLIFFIMAFLMLYWRPKLLEVRWIQIAGIMTVFVAWICSEAGWVTAEVGRQPWLIEGVLPRQAAISYVSSSSVVLTFTLFAIFFTLLLAAEVSIMVNVIRRKAATGEYIELSD